MNLNNCTELTNLPDWVFELSKNKRVTAISTGISQQLMDEYNERQNAEGYTGPIIALSIHSFDDCAVSDLINSIMYHCSSKTYETYLNF